MTEFIQNPGDTLYLPPNTAHAVLSLGENISITQNILGSGALKDLPLHLMRGGTALPAESTG